MHFTLTPAYGRDYTSKLAIQADLLAERDFISLPADKYINLQQMAAGDTINVRYKGLRNVAVFSVDTLRKHRDRS